MATASVAADVGVGNDVEITAGAFEQPHVLREPSTGARVRQSVAVRSTVSSRERCNLAGATIPTGCTTPAPTTPGSGRRSTEARTQPRVQRACAECTDAAIRADRLSLCMYYSIRRHAHARTTRSLDRACCCC